MVEVTQADRHLAFHLFCYVSLMESAAKVLRGEIDDNPIVKYATAHRIAAEKAVLDRLRYLPDDVASYIAQKHCFSYEVAKIVGKDLATTLADAMEANNGH